jgi:Tol biopolymer transport system component
MSSPLTTDPGIESHPDLSPDERRLAFHLKPSQDSQTQLVVQEIKGAGRRVLGPIDRDCVPRWSPDGRRIAYVRKAADGFELVTVTPDASQLELVTRISTPDGSFRAINPFMLCWTVDGKAIVFSESPDGKEPLSLIWVSLSSGERRRLTWPAPVSYGDTQPAFSPDRRWLAFVRNPTFGKSDILLLPVGAMNQGAAEPKLVHHEEAMIDGLAWMPDSSGLVLASSRENGHMALWQLSLAASGHLQHLTGRESIASFPSSVRTLANGSFELVYESKIQDANVRYSKIGPLMTGEPLAPSTALDFSSQFSPDGSQIAFSSRRSGSMEIWVCNREGSDLRQVSKMGHGWNDSPRWSPDGKWITFTSLPPGGNRDIYLVPSSGGTAQPLVSDRAEEGRSSWSRDGRWIYFASNRSGKRQLWKIPVSGGTAVQVTFGGGCEGYESSDGKTLYYIQDRDRPGLWAVSTGGGTEKQLLPNVRQDYWSVTDEAIYYLSLNDKDLLRYDLATAIGTHSGHLGDGRTIQGHLSVTHDGGSIVWVQIDSDQCDLMTLRFYHTGKGARWFSSFTF